MSRKERVRQVEFGFANWGGKRKGAGRRPKGEKACVSHAKRATLASRFPVHVTMKLERGLPSLRQRPAFSVVRQAFARATGRFGFRLVHWSVQTNHVHLLVEAEDERALSRGMQGLGVRVARSLNVLWRRAGRVLADRYHARILHTPREVRNALRYVLANAHKHGVQLARGLDPFSSGEDFDGWEGSCRKICADSASSLFGRARTWLLRVGWRRHGFLGWDECPAPLVS